MAAPDGDELQTWADERAAEWVRQLRLEVDERPLSLEVVTARASLLPGQGGLDLLRFEADLAADAPRDGTLTYADANFEGRVGWREITAVGQDGAALSGSSVPAGSVSDALRAYPDDLLSSPLDVREATASFAPGDSAPAMRVLRRVRGLRAPGGRGRPIRGSALRTRAPGSCSPAWRSRSASAPGTRCCRGTARR